MFHETKQTKFYCQVHSTLFVERASVLSVSWKLNFNFRFFQFSSTSELLPYELKLSSTLAAVVHGLIDPRRCCAMFICKRFQHRKQHSEGREIFFRVLFLWGNFNNFCKQWEKRFCHGLLTSNYRSASRKCFAVLISCFMLCQFPFNGDHPTIIWGVKSEQEEEMLIVCWALRSGRSWEQPKLTSKVDKWELNTIPPNQESANCLKILQNY